MLTCVTQVKTYLTHSIKHGPQSRLASQTTDSPFIYFTGVTSTSTNEISVHQEASQITVSHKAHLIKAGHSPLTAWALCFRHYKVEVPTTLLVPIREDSRIRDSMPSKSINKARSHRICVY